MMKRILTPLLLLCFLQQVSAQRLYNKPLSDAPLYVSMVKVDGGVFDLGSDDEAVDRKPAHSVTLKDYNISTFEITQEQWKAVMGTNPSKYVCMHCPVTGVSWTDIQSFITKLNSMTGKQYRLPTEAEWEYAARGGSKEKLVRAYNKVARGGVNELFITNKNERVPEKMLIGKKYSGKKLPQDVAWYAGNSKDRVHEIGMKKGNELGIFDMSGNVEEWCSDWYAGNYGSKGPVENPQGPTGGNAHVVRGGSWSSSAAEIVVTRRAAYLPGTKANNLGFRLVLDNK